MSTSTLLKMTNFFSNIYNKWFGKSTDRILILGLNGGVGKTTVLFQVKDGIKIEPVHTCGFNLETMKINNKSYEVFDIGGGDRLIPLWRHYFEHCRAVIFVIDSTYKDSLDSVEYEVNKLLNEKQLEKCPFLLYANKQDLPDAISVDELREALKLDQWKNRKIHLQSAVANQGTGISEGFDWLRNELANA